MDKPTGKPPTGKSKHQRDIRREGSAGRRAALTMPESLGDDDDDDADNDARLRRDDPKSTGRSLPPSPSTSASAEREGAATDGDGQQMKKTNKKFKFKLPSMPSLHFPHRGSASGKVAMAYWPAAASSSGPVISAERADSALQPPGLKVCARVSYYIL